MVILCRCGKLGMQSGEVGNKTPQHWEGPVFICDKPTHAKDTDYTTIFIWVFPTIGVPKNGWWKIMENPIKMDDCRGTLFLEAPNIYTYIYIYDNINTRILHIKTHLEIPWGHRATGFVGIQLLFPRLRATWGNFMRISKGWVDFHVNDVEVVPLVGQPKNSYTTW